MDETDVEPVAHPVEVDFSDQLAILGYELASGRVTPDEQLIVSVYWRAIDAMPETYTGFLHLTGPDGQLVAQDDHELGRGVFCTQLWQPGEVVREEYVLAVPGDAAAGRYTLRVGVYSFPSLERLAVSSADVSVQDDLATLGTVDLALRVGPGE